MSVKTRYKLSIVILIIIISFLHYFIGEADSPVHNFYRLLYYIPIIIAAFNFGFRGGVIASLIVCLIYSPFMLLSIGAFGWQTVNELLDVVLFFAVGIITGTLVEKKNMSLLKLDNELKNYVILENYTKNIIESIKSGVIAVNNDMLITMINQGAKELLGINDDCIGQTFTDIFSCCETIKSKIVASIKESMVFENIEIELQRDEKPCSVWISLFPLSLENLNKGLVIVIDDVTEIKKLQQQLQRNEKLAALGELSSGIAHEIRNPLGIIKAIEQTMRNELAANPEAVKELEIIDEEVERANRVVKALMEFGKPTTNNKMFCSINAVLEDVLTITNKYITQHKVNVEFKKTDIPDALIDKEQLKQAFVNVIFNAVQAMPDGGRLKISTNQDENSFVKILFEDTGVGIEEKNINKIFNPFFTTKDEGTGLGLPIVNRIIDGHNGTINITSKVGEGTMFEILIPLYKGELFNQ